MSELPQFVLQADRLRAGHHRVHGRAKDSARHRRRPLDGQPGRPGARPVLSEPDQPAGADQHGDEWAEASAPVHLSDLVEGLWQDAFTQQGYVWPSDVYNLSPTVAAPGFDDFLENQWDADAVAPQTFLDQIIPETRATRLGTWIGTLQNLAVADNTERLRHVQIPTLVLWAAQDFLFSRDDEQVLIDALTAATQEGGSFWWKQYGILSPPPSGEQTDLSHNLVWEAPEGVATDIASYLKHSQPTRTLYHTNYPADINEIVADPRTRNPYPRRTQRGGNH